VTTPRSHRSAIVLAGGSARRFGRDKLREPIDGRPLLHHAVDAVHAVADDVVVVAAPGMDPALPPETRLTHDEVGGEGPLAGLLAGLLIVRAPLVIVVGGDMPSLQPVVLDRMARALASSAADLVVLDHLGRRRPLPVVVRTGAATALARRLTAEGERRLGAMIDRSATVSIPESDWRAFDPEALTMRDVDEPGDLQR
jgi:molybdopterin-guanine dinucleotide biosynthesis protein A